jgi:hypothetical protein
MNASGGVRVLVTGGRDFADREWLFAVLDAIHAERGIACIVEGGASGADRLAKEWTWERGIALKEYPADWKEHGRAAGPIRNRKMLREGLPDLVVAFPGGRGTADMIRAAKAAGVEVLEQKGGAKP